MYIRLLHARVDAALFLFALVDVPTRQTVFDLAVGPRVLVEDGDANSGIRQNLRRHRARNRTANYRHEMTPRIRHRSATPAHWSAIVQRKSHKVSTTTEEFYVCWQ